MKIVQILTTISFGDAVSNDALALNKIIKIKGFKTTIYAENIDSRLRNSEIKRITKLPRVNAQDIVLYHLSTGTELNYKLEQIKGHKIIIYHNITPPEFFNHYNADSFYLCDIGLRQTKLLANIAEYVIADSNYNKECLQSYGYKCDIDVLPILIPMEDYQKRPNDRILEKFQNDGYTNILFTGRIAPNKKQEDIIRAFACYKKYYNKKARLIIVGSYGNLKNYYDQLNTYTEQLQLSDVIFTGHIPFDEILAYYKLADLFLCQSEHEGFCVPLVEAMIFRVPIVAYDSSAIRETLGGSGFLLENKNAVETAGVINKVLTDSRLKDTVIKNQTSRLADFQFDKIENLFWRYMDQYMEKIYGK